MNLFGSGTGFPVPVGLQVDRESIKKFKTFIFKYMNRFRGLARHVLVVPGQLEWARIGSLPEQRVIEMRISLERPTGRGK